MMSLAREAHTRELAQHYGPASSDVSPEQIETAIRIYMDAAEAMHDELMEERKFERENERLLCAVLLPPQKERMN